MFPFGSKSIQVADIPKVNLTDEEVFLCSCQVFGFSLVTKRWGKFNVKDIEEVDFNRNAFDGLVLPRHQKALICSLVTDYQNKHSGFDDMIKGKGKGLIFLLHGPPGVGKTLTAGKASHVYGSKLPTNRSV